MFLQTAGMEELMEDFEIIFDDEDDFYDEIRDYNVRRRNEHFESWNDNEFFDRFRLSKTTVEGILNLIQNDVKNRTNRY